MRSRRALQRVLGVFVGAVATTLAMVSAAMAQVSIDPTFKPTKNTGGWVYGMAVLLFLLGAVICVLVVVGYMRFAPRFARERAEGPRAARASRPFVGEEIPRRAVSISNAPPLIVPAPAVPVTVAAPAAPAPAAPSPERVAAAVSAGASGGETLRTPGTEVAASEVVAAPGGAVSTPEAPALPVEAPPAPAAGERPEVALDQETFDKTLAELLEKGTDRRVAEGQARRAAMIAARKKAAGG